LVRLSLRAVVRALSLFLFLLPFAVKKVCTKRTHTHTHTHAGGIAGPPLGRAGFEPVLRCVASGGTEQSRGYFVVIFNGV